MKLKYLESETEICVNMMNKGVSMYDLRRWHLLEENRLRGSMQLPVISKDPG